MSRFLCEKVVFSFLDRLSCDYLMLDKSNGLVDDNKIEHQLIEQTYIMENLREVSTCRIHLLNILSYIQLFIVVNR